MALAGNSWNGTPLHDKLLSTACRGLWGLEGDIGWGDAGRPTKVGIDAPLGWPEPFPDALDAHRRLQPWPSAIDNSRAQFERRATDFFVHQRAKKLPLSVTTDRIAYPAMRCAVILGDLAQHLPAELLLRDGSGLIAEVYPDAALRLWLPDVWAAASRDSYKGAAPRAQARRTFITESLIDRLGDRIAITDEQRRLCETSDDCLDAFVCALIARAAERGMTLAPDSPEAQRLAEVEGWLHLPTEPLGEHQLL